MLAALQEDLAVDQRLSVAVGALDPTGSTAWEVVGHLWIAEAQAYPAHPVDVGTTSGANPAHNTTAT